LEPGEAPREDGAGPEVDRRSWEAAWDSLATKYLPAFHQTARDCLRRMGGGAVTPDFAEAVVQGFLCACLDKRWLARAAREFRRLRAFVFTVLRRYTPRCLLGVALDRVARRSPRNAPMLSLVLREAPRSNTASAEFLGLGREKIVLARHRGLRMLREEIGSEVGGAVSSEAAYVLELGVISPYLADAV
jgi:hypothetical protein